MDDWEDLEPDGTESNDEPIIDHVKPDDGAQESVEVSDDEIRGSDAPVCRICFGGAEEQDLGRLISPCLCRGSVAKVHVQCLNTWRSVSRGSTSFFQCDQCKYKYRLKRARIAGLAENRYALMALAGTFFLFLVYVNGHIGNWLIRRSQAPGSIISTLFFDGPNPSYDVYDTWPLSSNYMSFEAVGQAVKLAHRAAANNPLTKRIEYGDATSDVTEARYTGSGSESSYRMIGKRSKSRRKRILTRLGDTMTHMSLGFSMTGIGSFFWMVMSLPWLPLHPLRNGLFRTVRSSRDERGRLNKFGVVLVVLFIMVGLVKSLQLCWRLTQRSARYLLKRAEQGILEVHAHG